MSKEPVRVVPLAEIASSPSAPRNDEKEERVGMVGKEGRVAETEREVAGLVPAQVAPKKEW